MTAWLSQPWIAWAAAAVLLVGGLWLLLWALFADRARGRRRCPKCWYDLRGAPATDEEGVVARCPECGYRVRRERYLRRTRRRWRLAVVAVLVIALGTGSAITPKVRKDGWLSLVPTTVLLWMLPPAWEFYMDSYFSPEWPAGESITSELYRRGADAEMWQWQWNYVVNRKRMLHTRSHWPRGAPLAFNLQFPPGLGHAAKITVRPRFASDCAVVVAGCDWHGEDNLSFPLANPIWTSHDLEAETRTFEFDYQIESFNRKRVCSGVIHVPVVAVESVDSILEPVRDESLTSAMRKAMRLELWIPNPNKSRRHTPCLVYEHDRSGIPELAGVAYGIAIELLRDEEVALCLRVHLQDDTNGRDLFDPVGSAADDWPAPADMMRSRWYASENEDRMWDQYWARLIKGHRREFVDPEAVKHWQIRVRGDGEMALTDWAYDKYWAGEFTVPLADIIVNGE